MNKKATLTQERVKELLLYDSLTGEFTWRIKPCKNLEANTRAGAYRPDGYYYININYVKHYGHHLAWLYMFGSYPYYLDHIDGNPSNNRIENLRLSSHGQNMHNQKISKANTSGVKGVCFDKNKNRYIADVQCQGISKTKSFSVLKHGSKEKALQLATDFVVTLRNNLHKEFANHGI